HILPQSEVGDCIYRGVRAKKSRYRFDQALAEQRGIGSHAPSTPPQLLPEVNRDLFHGIESRSVDAALEPVCRYRDQVIADLGVLEVGQGQLSASAVTVVLDEIGVRVRAGRDTEPVPVSRLFSAQHRVPKSRMVGMAMREGRVEHDGDALRVARGDQTV